MKLSQQPAPHPGIFLLVNALESKLDEKYCPGCGTVMSRKLDFGKDKNREDGLNRHCKDCMADYRHNSDRGY